MREVLERLNEKYNATSWGHNERFDYAAYMFLNIAYMSEERQDLPDTVRDVQEALAEAVEAAFDVMQRRHADLRTWVDNSFEELNELKKLVKEKYRFASECVDFNSANNSKYRAAAQNVIGLALAEGKVHINASGDGAIRDVFKAYRAIVKAL